MNNDNSEIKHGIKSLLYERSIQWKINLPNIFLKFNCIEAGKQKPISPTKRSLNVKTVIGEGEVAYK